MGSETCHAACSNRLERLDFLAERQNRPRNIKAALSLAPAKTPRLPGKTPDAPI